MNKDDIKLAKYRWEFLRRHPQYKKDYKKFQKRNYILEFFQARWLMEEPLDPAFSYEEQKKKCKDLYNKANDPPQFESIDEYLYYIIIKSFHLYPPASDSQNFIEGHYQIPDIIWEEGKIDITVNLSCPPTVILKEVKKILLKWQNDPLFLQHHKETADKTRSWHPFPLQDYSDSWDTYLEIWDWHYDDNKSYRDIAKIRYPDAFKDSAKGGSLQDPQDAISTIKGIIRTVKKIMKEISSVPT